MLENTYFPEKADPATYAEGQIIYRLIIKYRYIKEL